MIDKMAGLEHMFPSQRCVELSCDSKQFNNRGKNEFKVTQKDF